jgi:hypothetical protein
MKEMGVGRGGEGERGRFLLIINLLSSKSSSNLCPIWIITVRKQ